MVTIDKVCSSFKCEEKMVGRNIPFHRIRRITGYLVGEKKRFNNAKSKELDDRVKHGLSAGEGYEKH